jgi:hypothetical protein
VPDTDVPASPLAAFRGPVACRRAANVLTLSGWAADSAEERLILTFVSSSIPEMPDSLSSATVHALGERDFRITSAARDWSVEATSFHVHRDIGEAFYRAIPPRPTPLRKRLFWRLLLALAATTAGKRLLLSLRRPSASNSSPTGDPPGS